MRIIHAGSIGGYPCRRPRPGPLLR